jgi:hypothetical protein
VSEAEQIAEEINKFGAMFDVLCTERHAAGAEEYGALTFLGNDVVRMMMEELADTANYCRYQFVKLMFLQERLEAMMVDLPGFRADNEIQMGLGAGSFKGVGETGWQKK